MHQNPIAEKAPTTTSYYEFPKQIFQYATPPTIKTQVIFGNCYANTLALLHWLIAAGVLSLSEDKYNEFAKLYRKGEYIEQLLDLDAVVVTPTIKEKFFSQLSNDELIALLTKEEVIIALKNKKSILTTSRKNKKSEKVESNDPKSELKKVKLEVIDTLIEEINTENRISEFYSDAAKEIITYEELVEFLTDKRLYEIKVGKLPVPQIRESLYAILLMEKFITKLKQNGFLTRSFKEKIVTSLTLEEIKILISKKDIIISSDLEKIYTLIDENLIANFSKKDDTTSEAIIKKIINIFVELETIAEFKAMDVSIDAIFSSIKVVAKPRCIIKGGEVASLGVRDDWTLRLFKILYENDVPYEIEVSKNSLELLHCCHEYSQTKNFTESFKPHSLDEKQITSLLNVEFFVFHKLISENDFISYIDKYYKPHLKTLTCTRTNESFILSAHAFVGLEAVGWLARYFRIFFDAKKFTVFDAKKITADDLEAAIKAINNNFKERVLSNKLITEDVLIALKENNIRRKCHPLLYIMYFQDNLDTFGNKLKQRFIYDEKNNIPTIYQPAELAGCKMFYIHGLNGFHHTVEKKGYTSPKLPNTVNLDSYFAIPSVYINYRQFFLIFNQGSIIKKMNSVLVDKAVKDIDILETKYGTIKRLTDKSASILLRFSETFSDIAKRATEKVTLTKKILNSINIVKPIILDKDEFGLLKEGDLHTIITDHAKINSINDAGSITITDAEREVLKEKLENYIKKREFAKDKSTIKLQDTKSESIKFVIAKIKNHIANISFESNNMFTEADKKVINDCEDLKSFVVNNPDFFQGMNGLLVEDVIVSEDNKPVANNPE